MTEPWCSACGAGLGPGFQGSTCPHCRAPFDRTPWKTLEALERIQGVVASEPDLPTACRIPHAWICPTGSRPIRP